MNFWLDRAYGNASLLLVSACVALWLHLLRHAGLLDIAADWHRFN